MKRACGALPREGPPAAMASCREDHEDHEDTAASPPVRGGRQANAKHEERTSRRSAHKALRDELTMLSRAPHGRAEEAGAGRKMKQKRRNNLPQKGRGAAASKKTNKVPPSLPPPPGTSRIWWDNNWHLLQEAMIHQAGACAGEGKGKGKFKKGKG